MLRQFLAVPKPDWAIPTDVAVMCVLITCHGGEYIGHGALGDRCAIRDSKSVLRSLKRLEAAGWVQKHDGGFRVLPDKFPKADEATKKAGE
jgi:hypothetical protein